MTQENRSKFVMVQRGPKVTQNNRKKAERNAKREKKMNMNINMQNDEEMY